MIIKLGSGLYLNYYRNEYKDKYNIIYKYLKNKDYVPGNVLFQWRCIESHNTKVFIQYLEISYQSPYIFILLIYIK